MSVRYDYLLAGECIVKSKAARPFDVESTLHTLIIGTRLNKRAFKIDEIIKISADLFDNFDLPFIQGNTSRTGIAGGRLIPGHSGSCGDGLTGLFGLLGSRPR